MGHPYKGYKEEAMKEETKLTVGSVLGFILMGIIGVLSMGVVE